MAFCLRNDEGKYAWPAVTTLLPFGLYPQMVDTWRKQKNTGIKGFTDEEMVELGKAMACLRNISQLKVEQYFAPNHKVHLHTSKGTKPYLLVMYHSSFQPKQMLFDHFDEKLTPDSYTQLLTFQTQLSPYVDLIRRFVVFCGVQAGTPRLQEIETTEKLLEELNTGKVFFEPVDFDQHMGEVDNYMVYIPNPSGGGYLQEDGSIGMLSSALLFQNPQQALCAGQGAGYEQMAAVKTHTSVVEVTQWEGEMATEEQQRYLTQAVMQRERMEIEHAVQQAEIQRLRERLAQYEPETLPVKKRL